MTLSSLGWDDFFAMPFRAFASSGLQPARVAVQHKHAYVVLSATGELSAVLTGALLHTSIDSAELPGVGDWVAISIREASARHDGQPTADIHAVLPRRTVFSRASPGGDGRQQVIAANIDTAFLVTGLDRDFNVRRVERYLAAARASGAEPVIVLNKADLPQDPATAVDQGHAAARGVPVIALSATHDADLAVLRPWLRAGNTIALLGSSGAGKSTLINRLLGAERLATGAVSPAVNKGRHTTVRRELIALPCGALVIDTPGLRELQLWGADQGDVSEVFYGLAALAASCRFHDCTHGPEPGCAVQAALESGTLDPARWQSYLKLQREQAYAARRADPELARASRERWKKIHRDYRQRTRFETEG
jgi:ribosome biogenesis GTPase / thiamine phosphate phosphatase